MNEVEHQVEHLLEQSWLERDVAEVHRLASQIGRRRRRTGVVVVGAFAIVLILGAVAVASRRASTAPTVLTAAQGQTLECASVLRSGIGPGDLIVTMDPAARSSEVENVRVAVAALPGAHDVQVQAKAENLKEFQSLFADTPDMVASVDESLMSVTVTAALNEAPGPSTQQDSKELVHDFDPIGRLPGVVSARTSSAPCSVSDPAMRARLDQYLRGRWQGGIDLIAFVEPEATEEQTTAVQQALLSRADVLHITRMSKDDALVEFRCLFRDSPEMIESVKPEILPVSYRLDLAEGTSVEDVREQIAALPAMKVAVGAPSIDDFMTNMTPELFAQLSNPRAGAACSPTPTGVKLK